MKNSILIAVTEKRTRSEIERFAAAFAAAVENSKSKGKNATYKS
jgi:glycine cleavage system protein P-like pyridoxal-binding family